MKTLFSVFFLSFFLVFNLFSQINYPNTTRLNDNWDFYRGDLGGVWETLRPFFEEDNQESTIDWERVSLPHCFNAEDAVDPYTKYYQGAGWYRALVEIKNPYENGRVLLHFEGAGQKTKVFVYLHEIASHVGGYDEWTVDITDAVRKFLQSDEARRFNGKIPLAIRCDNSRDVEMIPSDLSDFNLYGGIYRYLNLVYTPSLSVSGLHTETSLDLKKKEGLLNIHTEFENHKDIQDAEMQIEIYSPKGNLIKSETKKITDFYKANIFTLKISKPEYWSPASPALYSCKVTLNSNAGKTTYEEKFGFRSFEFVEKGHFLLNGKRLLLRGTHRHEDHAGVAAAMTEEMIIAEMQLIKEMGANFIRLGHYQQSRIVLEQCDKLGLLVWEEIPWCRGGLGGDEYQWQTKKMLLNMITQHRNHPSVILWGLGNENDWPGDFPDFDKEQIRSFMSELNDMAHALDPSRKTCIRRCEFCKDIVDVYSPSIWMGWYRGDYTEYKQESYKHAQTVNHFLHVEWGGDSHAGRHAETPYKGKVRPSVDGDWSETYICEMVDWHLKEQETMSWLTGAAYWPFKDFSTPLRPENPVPYVNQKGVVERDLNPKEVFYVFQSYWSEKPMVRIYGHNWHTRWGGENELKQIKVYSNCDRAELFLNGKSLGIKKRNSQDFPCAGLRWETALLKGKNDVKVIAYKGKTEVTDEISFYYQTEKWEIPSKMQTSIIHKNNSEAIIEVRLLDSRGVLCLDADNFVEFESIGTGSLFINQGTSKASKKVQAINGRAEITLNKNGGKSIVECKSKGIEAEFVVVE